MTYTHVTAPTEFAEANRIRSPIAASLNMVGRGRYLTGRASMPRFLPGDKRKTSYDRDIATHSII